MRPITPCLWFNKNALEAVRFYVSVFKNSKIKRIVYYPKSDLPYHRGMEGKPLLIEFTLAGRPFSALNGGPEFKPTEALSLQIWCKTQKEADGYWNKLSKGGDKRAQVCGWLKDKYGYSWQIGPQDIGKWLSAKDPSRRARVFARITGRKLDFKKLEAAYKGR
ncbi:MAG: hypothetical protein MOGMAGMI_02249 [Candidatus Omnitrophica bacterium]|nr:hypothetical protein [Candidatus Omnitrophota bacterium]